MIEMGDLSDNTTMKQLDIQEDMLLQALKIKRAANLPSLAASINYQWNAMDETMKISTFKWMGSSTAMFNLSVPIFSGGKRRAEVNQAKLDIETLQLQRENTERQLRTALMSYYSNMQTNVKQYHASAQTISQAKRGYEIAAKRYEVGSGTLVEMDNSQLAYTQAELSRSTAIYNYLINQVSMEKIAGNFSTDEQEN